MAKFISLSIPQGCTENWDGMTPVETGRYCTSCSKKVIDFTGMTDTQLASYFKKDTGRLCGRFYDDQLDRPMPIPRKQPPILKYFFTVTFPAFIFGIKAQAQHKMHKAETVLLRGSIDNLTHKAEQKKRCITGSVLDDHGNALMNASVIVAGSRMGVTADSLGNFIIEVVAKQDRLIISYAGYEQNQLLISEVDHYNVVLKLIDQETVIVPSYKTNRTISGDMSFVITRKVIKTKSVKENPFNIYPNPISANNFLHFSVNADASNNQNVEIFSANGQLIQQEIIVPSEQTGKILIGRLPKGYYIIKVTDPKKYTIHSKEFYVL